MNMYQFLLYVKVYTPLAIYCLVAVGILSRVTRKDLRRYIVIIATIYPVYSLAMLIYTNAATYDPNEFSSLCKQHNKSVIHQKVEDIAGILIEPVYGSNLTTIEKSLANNLMASSEKTRSLLDSYDSYTFIQEPQRRGSSYNTHHKGDRKAARGDDLKAHYGFKWESYRDIDQDNIIGVKLVVNDLKAEHVLAERVELGYQENKGRGQQRGMVARLYYTIFPQDNQVKLYTCSYDGQLYSFVKSVLIAKKQPR